MAPLSATSDQDCRQDANQ